MDIFSGVCIDVITAVVGVYTKPTLLAVATDELRVTTLGTGRPVMWISLTSNKGYGALARNGVASDIGFLQVLVTTRNPELDGLVEGSGWGGKENVPRRLKEIPLRFGRSLDGTNTFFGTNDTVLGFVKN